MKVRNVMILPVIIIVVIGTGWVKNIIKLSDCDFEASFKCEVVHGIGIIPPVGMITGWLDMGK